MDISECAAEEHEKRERRAEILVEGASVKKGCWRRTRRGSGNKQNHFLSIKGFTIYLGRHISMRDVTSVKLFLFTGI